MGGYSSTPKKAKTSEEGGDESLSYAASGMQGWRASMEDAHVALMKVPQGSPPSSAAIGAARIGIGGQSHRPPLGASSTNNASNGARQGAAGSSRVRAGTFSVGDAGESFPPRLVSGETQAAAGSRRASTGTTVEGALGAVERAGEGADDGGDGGSIGAGWKAVDLLEDAALFGVFDGHGGKGVADFCKERLPGLLAASPDIRAGNWKDGFPRVYHALDELLLSGEGQEKAGGWGGSTKVDGIGVGCTIVTALLDRKRRQCYVAHAGDSRCVLCRAGRAVQLTRDHKPGTPSEYARIVAAGGHVSRVGRVNDNLNLSRAIGDMVYKRNRLRHRKDQIISAEPDVCRFLVTPGVDEFLLLACDGVWELMDTTQVVAFVRSGLRAGSSPREVCESLLDACLSPDPRGTRYAGCDNMSVVLVLLEGWEAALATKAYTPAFTFSGGGLGGVAEAAAALSATLPRIPRKSGHRRPPLPAEFRAMKAPPKLRPPSATPPTAPTDASRKPGRGDEAKAATEAEAEAEAKDEPRGEGDTASATSAGDGMSMGWLQRRIATGKVAPPRTAHGIEFALAAFSAPLVPIGLPAGSRASTGSLIRGAGGKASARGSPIGESRQRSASHTGSAPPPTVRRRNSSHNMRSATAPMLPSPLLHRREPPSEERLAAAAAIAVLGEVGAAGAVAGAVAAATAAATAAEENEAPQYRSPTRGGKPGIAQLLGPVAEGAAANAGEGGKRQAVQSGDAGLVFVPVPDEMTPAEVTVTASASPSRGHHSE